MDACVSVLTGPYDARAGSGIGLFAPGTAPCHLSENAGSKRQASEKRQVNAGNDGLTWPEHAD